MVCIVIEIVALYFGRDILEIQSISKLEYKIGFVFEQPIMNKKVRLRLQIHAFTVEVVSSVCVYIK